ncbi:hypothetical protein KM427_08045 [Nocardioides sp. LMS-CY]|uniref:hypothetical protein n=1 Tax=Nocardioides sp. (strain LMS-CY) TaxID=2840457 RepID=UPI001C005F01|nr:hypothetical protein [Nocardioides sp. LMS-CY]QWF23642.1 hypothetical protein KM427_08045 [Nocardioides sp. LMS-CY]
MNDLDYTDDLHALMDRTLADLPVPTHRLHEGALRHGRRVRRRRRLRVAAGGTVAAAALVAAALPVLGGGTGTADGGVAVEPTPTPLARPFEPHPGWWDMPVGEMRHRLEALLPDDVVVESFQKRNTEAAPGESRVFHGRFGGVLRSADDTGPGSIEIMLVELPQDATALADLRSQHLSCAGFPESWTFEGPVSGATCEEGDLQDGRPAQRTIAFTDQGVEYREVRRWTDRGEIYAAVSSSTERKWGPPASARHAPLTPDELLAVGTSATWTDWEPAD